MCDELCRVSGNFENGMAADGLTRGLLIIRQPNKALLFLACWGGERMAEIADVPPAT